ncbi:hypothetical protein [Sphingomonas sp. Leaf67]|uniref:hypothetical protein n=1 Tax=Sphingomonas sp. Leaf67 TaxID=1736230 RepID=UPI0012E2CD79|nr:hypothetical protein [Sphingomonas sp. Leaf67]
MGKVVSKLRERGVPLEEVREGSGGLHLDVRPLTVSQAMTFGDRACLALALELGGETYTTDAALAHTEIGTTVVNVRA